MTWLNGGQLIIVLILVIPSVIYFFKYSIKANRQTNRWMDALEKIGQYGCIVLMCIYIGKGEEGFISKTAFVVWLVGIVLLIGIYVVVWALYIKEVTKTRGMILAIIPSVVFIGTGFVQHYWLLVLGGCVFAIGHIYMTYTAHKGLKH